MGRTKSKSVVISSLTNMPVNQTNNCFCSICSLSLLQALSGRKHPAGLSQKNGRMVGLRRGDGG